MRLVHYSEHIIAVSVTKTHCTFSDEPSSALIRKITDPTATNDLPLAFSVSFFMAKVTKLHTGEGCCGSRQTAGKDRWETRAFIYGPASVRWAHVGEQDGCPSMLHTGPYFKRCYQGVANKMSAVKFYRPVKCNLIKAVKCLLY